MSGGCGRVIEFCPGQPLCGLCRDLDQSWRRCCTVNLPAPHVLLTPSLEIPWRLFTFWEKLLPLQFFPASVLIWTVVCLSLLPQHSRHLLLPPSFWACSRMDALPLLFHIYSVTFPEGEENAKLWGILRVNMIIFNHDATQFTIRNWRQWTRGQCDLFISNLAVVRQTLWENINFGENSFNYIWKKSLK